MAKGKKAKASIPKKIAGVKVPKSVRKGRFGELLASRTGQALIAQAILGAGAVAAGMKAKDSPKIRKFAAEAKHQVEDTGQSATSNLNAAGSTVAYAFGEAARTFVEALRRGETRSFAAAEDADTAWTPDYGAPEAPPRKAAQPFQGERR
jgi:hypothetical protein